MIDVYLYGMISASTVYVLDDGFFFPQPNHYAEIRQSFPSIGGEAVNSAIMLSKLGVRTMLDGNWINLNNEKKIRHLLEPFHIDISRLTITQNHGTEEIVITDKQSRTVFGNYAGFHAGEKQWNDPRESDIRNARIVSVDPYFREESVMAAQFCVNQNKPYVTLDCPYDGFIARHAAAVIISHELRDQVYADQSPPDVFGRYQSFCSGLIIFTFGEKDLWYARPGQEIKKFKPYAISPIDTTGAGDSFRSGIIYGLLHSWDDRSTIEFASAVAACVCMTIPHTLNAPGLEDILAFIKEQNRKQPD